VRADDPNVEEVEVGDAGLGLVDIVQPAPLVVLLLPPRLHQWPSPSYSISLPGDGRLCRERERERERVRTAAGEEGYEPPAPFITRRRRIENREPTAVCSTSLQWSAQHHM
jgi:hypothetical protein